MVIKENSKKLLTTKKKLIVLSLTSALVITCAAIVWGTKSKAASSDLLNISEYSTSDCEPMTAEEKNELLDNAVSIDSVEDYYDYVENGIINETYCDIDAESFSSSVSESLTDADTQDTTYRFPQAVDNSDTKFFPPIGDQGGAGSCISWAMVYYQMSYMYNRAMNLDADSDGKVFSPTWAYELATSEDGILNMLKQMGAATVEDVPIVTQYYLNGPGNRMFADKGIWEDAINYRISDYYTIANPLGARITSPDSTALDKFKAALSNGDILSFSTDIDKWRSTTIKYSDDDIYSDTDNKKYAGEFIVSRCDKDGGGGHKMTIVGYNDNIWVDINENGTKEAGEMGAFKIANSWGDWANDGFIWLSYETLNRFSSIDSNSNVSLNKNRSSSMSDIYGIRINTDPSKIYAKLKVKTNYIGENIINVTAQNNNDKKSYTMFKFNGAVNQNGFDGTSKVTTGTVVVALDNVVEGITSDNLADYDWKINVDNRYNDENSITIQDVEIVDNSTGKIYNQNIDKELTLNYQYKNIELSTNNTSESTVIYYKGFASPNIYYCIDGESWITYPGISMTPTNEKDGFTHKAIIYHDSASAVSVCFNEDRKNWDSNNGSNYRFEAGTYTYVNGNITRLSNSNISSVLDVGLKASEYDTHEINKNITLHADCSKTDVSYRFGYIENGTETILSDYSSSNEAIWKATKAGVYTLFVDAKDSTGKVKRDCIYEYTVSPLTITGLTTDYSRSTANPQRAGSTVSLEANITFAIINTSKHISYIYEAILDGESTLIPTLSDNSANWTPTKKGTYTIKVTVTDSAGQIATYEEKFKIKDSDASFKIDEIEFNNGDDIIMNRSSYVSVTFDGGTAPYYTTLGYYDKDGNEVVIESDATYGYLNIPTPFSGDITYFFLAKDSTGATDREERTINIKHCTIKEIITSPSNKVLVGEPVTLSVSTENEFDYRGSNSRAFNITNNETGETTTISFYTYQGNSTTWTPTVSGTYTIEAVVNTYSGDSDTASIQYKVVEQEEPDTYISDITTSIKSPAVVNNSISFSVAISNNVINENNLLIYEITNNTDNTTITGTEHPYLENNERFIWTPNKAGEYTIRVIYNTAAVSSELSIDYTIIDEPVLKNSVTIYYKGFDAPYIHYQLGDGWTTVPGIAMTECSELAGYTHKCIIDLGKYDYINACFNNGNNTWDSNNGKNYTFARGRYAYSNGVSKQLDENNKFIVTENTATIYYNSSYTTPYIHYQIGNGAWTNVPGVAMTVANDVNGYTHKAVIDLGDYTFLNACFNNGSNSWDSNNGKNYSFSGGSYGVSNGVISTVN